MANSRKKNQDKMLLVSVLGVGAFVLILLVIAAVSRDFGSGGNGNNSQPRVAPTTTRSVDRPAPGDAVRGNSPGAKPSRKGE